MRIEIPEPQRCCFCLPLRRGLLAWVYFKMVLALLQLLYVLVVVITKPKRSSTQLYVIVTITFILLTIETLFDILFIISAHKKNHQYMRVYYRYAIGILICYGLALLGVIVLEICDALFLSLTELEFFLLYMIELICFTFVLTAIQGYLVILIRSELLKLEKGANFEFTYHTTEPICNVQIIP